MSLTTNGAATLAFNPSETNLDAWLTYVEGINRTPIELGLARMKTMIERLEISFECPVFTVAGTNGKGSTCSMMESVLRHAGYRVGMHTSPHLVRFNERVVINGAEATDSEIVEAFREVEAARGDILLTYFEFTGLAILKMFQKAKLDAVILEIGLGGRLDAMNAIDTSCGIVCAVGVDHTAFLGDTREKIGYEKAGIYRSGIPAVVTDREPPESLIEHASSIGALLNAYGSTFETVRHETSFDFEFHNAEGNTEYKALPLPSLKGINQIQNAAGVLAALTLMKEVLPVSRKAIEEGLTSVNLTARFERIERRAEEGADVVLDVGHNPNAATVLAANVEELRKTGSRIIAVCGMLADKDMAGVMHIMAPVVDEWFVAGLTGPRAADGATLTAAMKDGGIDMTLVMPCESIGDALTKASERSLRLAPAPVTILAFGSFVTVAAVIDELRHSRAVPIYP